VGTKTNSYNSPKTVLSEILDIITVNQEIKKNEV